jgi:hypothetical protein
MLIAFWDLVYLNHFTCYIQAKKGLEISDDNSDSFPCNDRIRGVLVFRI